MLTFKNMVSKLTTRRINAHGNSLSHLFKFPSCSFSSEAPEVNFAFHKSDKPKLKIKFGGSATPFMPQRDIPFFVIKESSRKENKKGVWPTISTGEIKYSSWKLNDTCRLIRGKFIRTALAILENSHTKGAGIVKKELSTFLENKDRQSKKREEKYIKKRQAKLEQLEKESRAQEEDSPVEENPTEEISIDLEKESSHSEANQSEVLESITIESGETKKEIILRKDDRPYYKQNILPYEDYRIVEAYVGRKKGHSVPSPRAKGKTDRIYRSISKLYIRIEKIKTHEFCQSVAIGKAEPYLAAHIRQILFMHNASLQTMRHFSFITTSRGRKYRQMQFSRLVSLLREKIHKEKGIKLNIDIIRDQLKKHLGGEIAFINPAHLNYLLSHKQVDPANKKINEENNLLLEDKQKVTLDKSYAAREAQFNINYKKIE